MRRLLIILSIFWLMDNLVIAQDEALSPYEIALERISEADISGVLRLDLGYLRLSELPPEIGNLSNLIELGLSENNLTSLPLEIGNLSNLIVLRLMSNELTSLPSEIGNLSNLRHLNLHNNELTSLPSEIGNLSNLTSLILSDNPLSSPPVEVIEQGTSSIQSYLRNPALWHLQRLIIKVAIPGIILALLGFGLRWRIHRNRKPKKKKIEA